MAGFRKAKAEQAALKVGFYGTQGSGKTFTALLCAEGLTKASGKRVAYVDTEHGTDFYCQAVPARKVHPEAFDFDAIYTRSISEASAAIRGLDPNDYCCVVVDSITHLWEAAIAAYSGRTTGAGTIPFHAWAKIKKPYKDLLQYLLNSPMHFIICGRQSLVWEENEQTGEMKAVGTKMKAEGETPYEPHIVIHMEALRQKDGSGIITAFAEKDRTGVLSGTVIRNPDYKSLIMPLLPLLGGTQAQMDVDGAASRDAEAAAEADKDREAKSAEKLARFTARLTLCQTAADVAAVGKEITAAEKAQMLPADVADLREVYRAAEAKAGGRPAPAKAKEAPADDLPESMR